MGNKKQNGKPHPNKSFEQYVADATLQKFGGYIDGQIQTMGRAMAQYQMQQLGGIITRLAAIEEILKEKLGVTPQELAEKAAAYEDAAEGFQEVTDRGLAVGNRARIELEHKKTEDAEFSKPVRLIIQNAGSGNTLGKEFEESLIGLQKGETREVVYGKDGIMTAKLTINRLSARPTPPAPVQTETPEQSEATPESQPAA